MIDLRLLALLALALADVAAAAEEIRVDCGRPVGRIRAIHGVNNGPLANGENAKIGRWYAEAGFPVARLHDVRWPCPDACDISTIFPLMHLDPGDPRSYLFAKTDDYIAAILTARTKIVYRLGQSIEPWTKYHNASAPRRGPLRTRLREHHPPLQRRLGRRVPSRHHPLGDLERARLDAAVHVARLAGGLLPAP